MQSHTHNSELHSKTQFIRANNAMLSVRYHHTALSQRHIPAKADFRGMHRRNQGLHTEQHTEHHPVRVRLLCARQPLEETPALCAPQEGALPKQHLWARVRVLSPEGEQVRPGNVRVDIQLPGVHRLHGQGEGLLYRPRQRPSHPDEDHVKVHRQLQNNDRVHNAHVQHDQVSE